MFFCCEKAPEKGKHVLEMFQTPQELSAISSEKEIKLKAYIQANRPISNSKVIKGTSEKGTDLDNIMNYLNIHNQEFQDFVLKKIMKSNY
jgi:hypothetical protein